MKLLKRIFLLVFVLIIIIVVTIMTFLSSLKPKTAPQSENRIEFSAKRLTDSAIISQTFHHRLEKEAAKFGYSNINGPSLIRVPEWLPNPMGKYYLYFAHHKGSFIRLAYADTLSGPWKMFDGEILPLAKSGLATEAGKNIDLKTLRKYCSWSESLALIEIADKYKKDFEARTKEKIKTSKPTTPHLASPDVIIDNEAKQIRLYYHGVVEGNLQMSKVALSTDGLNFEAKPEIITLPYLRIFRFRNDYYGLAMPGFLYRSKNGLTNFEVRKRWLFDTNIRHSGLYLKGNDLYIFYSKVGDEPESILYTKTDLTSKDWDDWKVEPSKELMKSELEWEGANIPVEPSTRGEIGIRVNQLRDPYIFEDEDGELYLLYAGGGEQGIGIAKLSF